MLLVVKLLLYKVLKHNLLSFKTRTIKIQCLLIEWKVYSKVRISIWGGYTVRDFKNLCHMVGFPICVRDLPENEAKVLHFNH